MSGFDLDFKYPIRIVARWMLKYVATDFFACSEEAGEFMFGKHPQKEIKILVNAIEADKYAYDPEIRSMVRMREGINDFYVVGHVGRFVPVKNHEKLLEIFIEILKQKKNAILMLVGKGELENVIKEKAAALKISDKVYFMGSRDDVHELMQAMDLFILPSKYEGFGMVLLEAQTSGLPCLATAGAVPKKVQISPQLKYVALEECAKLWADAGLSMVEDRRSYSKEAKEKGYDIENEMNKLIDFYQDKWDR